MTLDEAIETLKIAKAEVEWEYPLDYAVAIDMVLEKLKFLQHWKTDIIEKLCKYDCNSVEEVAHNAYNKAIDDFVKALTTMYERYDIDDVFESSDAYSYTSACYIFEHYIEEIAERLKAGGENE